MHGSGHLPIQSGLSRIMARGRGFGIAVALSLIAGCAPTTPSAIVSGTWGGDHIRLDVTSLGATVEYDCAHGTIDEPLSPDRQGHFSAAGTHTIEPGGPVRVDEPVSRHPAQYTGQVSGDTLQLTVTVTDTQQTLGPFSLKLARAPRLFKCL